MQRKLTLPIRGLTPRDIHDTFSQGREGGKLHEATDLLAPRGTPIEAVEDGVIQKLFLSKPGGLTVYEFDREGIFCYYYAHLDHYADGLRGRNGGEARRRDRLRRHHRQCATADAAPAFFQSSNSAPKSTGGKAYLWIPIPF